MKLIVALIDFSDVTSNLITLAGELALALKCELILLHVAMPDADFIDDHEREDVSRQGIAGDLRHRHRELAILEAEVKKLGIEARTLMVRSDSTRGNPVSRIVQEVNRMKPDLVVLGSHVRGRLYQMIPAVSQTPWCARSVVRSCWCPGVRRARNKLSHDGVRVGDAAQCSFPAIPV